MNDCEMRQILKYLPMPIASVFLQLADNFLSFAAQ